MKPLGYPNLMSSFGCNISDNVWSQVGQISRNIKSCQIALFIASDEKYKREFLYSEKKIPISPPSTSFLGSIWGITVIVPSCRIWNAIHSNLMDTFWQNSPQNQKVIFHTTAFWALLYNKVKAIENESTQPFWAQFLLS